MSDTQAMCAECAFRKGCPTWHEPHNRVISQIAAAGPVPFLCHSGMDWESPLADLLPAHRLILPGRKPRVCAGWKQAVRARKWPADPTLRRWQRFLASQAILAFRHFEAGEASLRTLHLALQPLDYFYAGPRAWQIARMKERERR
jgi:hypothetical protein